MLLAMKFIGSQANGGASLYVPLTGMQRICVLLVNTFFQYFLNSRFSFC